MCDRIPHYHHYPDKLLANISERVSLLDVAERGDFRSHLLEVMTPCGLHDDLCRQLHPVRSDQIHATAIQSNGVKPSASWPHQIKFNQIK